MMIVQSVQKSLAILEVLSDNPSGIALNEISRRTVLNISTCHHILKTLEELGYVERVTSGRLYKMGPAMLIMASKWLLSSNVVSISIPHVNGLAQESGETVHLSVLFQGEAYDVAAKESSQRIRAAAAPGYHMPLHCTAVGKVLLAFQSDPERERLLRSIRPERFTNQTITNIDQLKNQIEIIRQNGFSINEKEFHEESSAIAAPVLNYRGDIVAALGVAVPVMRFTAERCSALVEMVKRRAQAISLELGFSTRTTG